jgi:hypothetical protein
MATAEDAVEAVTSTPYSTDRLTTGDWEQSAGVSGEPPTVASVTPKRAIALRQEAYDLDVPAYESFPSDSTTGDTDTFDLSYFPMDAPDVADSVVVYAGEQRVPSSEFSVDFSANTLEYTGDETADDIHVFYLSAMQANVELRKVAPNGTFEAIDRADLSLVNSLNTAEDPLEFDFDHALQPVIPAYYELQVRVDAPYPVRWSVDAGADGTARADQMLLDVPITRADRDLPEFVGSVVAAVAGAR